MSSVDGVKAQLRAGNEAALEGQQVLARVAVETAETTAVARTTLQDTQDSDVTAALAALAEAAQEIDLSDRRLTRAVDHVNKYLARL